MTCLKQGCEIGHRVFRSKAGWSNSSHLIDGEFRQEDAMEPLTPPSSSLLLWHWLAERHHLDWQHFKPPEPGCIPCALLRLEQLLVGWDQSPR